MARQADFEERDLRFNNLRAAMEAEGLIALVVAGHAGQFSRGYIRYLANAHMWAGDSLILFPLDGEAVHVQVTYAGASMPDNLWIPDFRRAPAPQTEIVSAILSKGLTQGNIGIAGFGRNISAGAFETITDSIPNVTFVNADLVIDKVRAIKSPLELEQFRDVSRLTQSALERFVDVIEPGMTQRDAAAEAASIFRAGGAFDDLTLIQEGSFSGLPRDIPLKCDDRVALHLEVCGESGHWSELNVTCIFDEPTEREQKLIDSELQAYQEVLQAAKPGVKLVDLENVFLQSLRDDGWELGDPAWHYSYHGVGLDAIEWPYYSPMLEGNQDTEIQEGMVFSYHPHRAVVPTVRRIPAIYDDFVITPNGGEQLTVEWDLGWRIMT